MGEKHFLYSNLAFSKMAVGSPRGTMKLLPGVSENGPV
jgi:hypothetical protein